MKTTLGGRTALVFRAWAIVALAGPSCGSSAAKAPPCQRDDQCGGDACVSGACLPRAAPPASWNVEVAPKTDSTAAFTELLGVSAPADAFDLTAASKATIAGTLASDSSATPLAAAHLVLKVPALIPGRPDLQYETDLLPIAPGATMPTFTLALPATCLGRTGSLQVLPTSPDDATHPPAKFTTVLAATLPLAPPSKALTVRGRLLSALGDPVTGLVARAFVGGNLVSNVANTTGTTDADRGTFTLMVPVDATATSSLAVELEPAATDASQPQFWAKPFALTANLDLGDIHLPAYSQPNVFKLSFQGEKDGAPVVNAIVRARTLLADDMTGTTDFLRGGVTDGDGQVSLSLLPGSTVAKRLYDIAVVPPAGSAYAATCLEMFPVVTGGVPPVTTLAQRPVVAGTVVGSDGLPVEGVVILATRTAGEHATACDDFAATPQVVATTLANGGFSLELDAGTYTFDLDPPAGEPYPRLTQTGVVVSAASTANVSTIALPLGALLEGTIRDAAGKVLPLAGVRFYGPACAAPATCAGGAPILEAQAHADASGHFRVVIPIDATP